MDLKKTASGLLIPRRMNDEPKYVCNVPGCGWKGYNQREQINHALSHANDEDLIAELTYDATEEILGEGDPEYRKYLRDRYEQLQGEVPDPLNPKHY